MSIDPEVGEEPAQNPPGKGPERSNAILGPTVLRVIGWGIVAIAGLLAVNYLTTYFTAKSYVDQIADAFDLSQHLARPIAIAVFFLLAYFGGKIFSLSKNGRMVGYGGIATLLVAHSLLLWRGTETHLFDRSGNAVKCYILTKDEIRYSERPGIDPSTGKQCRPITPQLVERLRSYEKGLRPSRVTSETPTFFDERTGEPVIWFSKKADGSVELFDLMGYHPETGEELLPIDKEAAQTWRVQSQQQKQRQEQAKREVAKRIDPTQATFFDLRTGQAIVWYRKDEQGNFEFYDAEGYHPLTGEHLEPVTKPIVDEWRQSIVSKSQARCYVITNDAVKYGDKPGLDSATGKECREITPGLIERLREYEKGKRPTRITAADVTFFDPRTGTPSVWYAKSKTGEIELFDLMGFHPSTGDELQPITASIVDEYKAQSRKVAAKERKPPQQIDPEKIPFFDPVTGEARVWYWKSPTGTYEFYDNEGFHPRTGEPLTVITKPAIEEWKAVLEKQKKEEADRRAKAEEERIQREKEARERAESERKIAAEINGSGEKCDKLAANPTDPEKPNDVAGVTWDELKLFANDAISACTTAVEKNPQIDRYKYQLARSLQIVNPDRAVTLYGDLVERKYVSAYDNYGWLLIQRQKNYAGAEKYFRMGAALGNPDAMQTLGELIQKKKISPNYENEGIDMMQKAAELGNADAQKFMAEYEQKRQEEVQAQEAMKAIFGGILQGAMKRH